MLRGGQWEDWLVIAKMLYTINLFILVYLIFGEFNVQVYWHPFNLLIFKFHKILQSFHACETLTCQSTLDNQKHFI